ncbi:MAG TPA: hypothetical protein VJ180_16110, partial [Pyrinomonadaceae bacterium]|nr:hypothetical protein [Pyrinomonadaceae bacterium]
SLLLPPKPSHVNPLRGEPLNGKPDAGNPPVRFGGRGSETNRLSLPLSGAVMVSVLFRLKLKHHTAEAGGV